MFLCVSLFIFKQNISIIVFPFPQLFPAPSHLPTHSTSFSLPQNKTAATTNNSQGKQITNKQAKKTKKIPNQNKTRTKHMESTLVLTSSWHGACPGVASSPWHGACPGVGSTHSLAPGWGGWVFPVLAGGAVHSFWVGHGLCAHVPSSVLEVLSFFYLESPRSSPLLPPPSFPCLPRLTPTVLSFHSSSIQTPCLHKGLLSPANSRA